MENIIQIQKTTLWKDHVLVITEIEEIKFNFCGEI